MSKATERRAALLRAYRLKVVSADIPVHGAVFDIAGPVRAGPKWREKVALSIELVASNKRLKWPRGTKVQLVIEVLADKAGLARKYALDKGVSKPWGSNAVPISAVGEALIVGSELRKRARLAGLYIIGMVARVIIPPRGEVVTGRGTLQRRAKPRKKKGN